MTQILLKDYTSTNTIHIFKFFSARIKRIIPAYYVFLILLIVMSLLFLDWHFVKKFINNIDKAFYFISNIWLMDVKAGYWDTSLTVIPFLHTWSLSIEWQFYIVYPLCIYIIVKLFKIKGVLIFNCLVFLGSIIYAKYLLNINNINGAYYLSLARVFELALGCIVASVIFLKEIDFSKVRANILQILGLILIIFSYFYNIKSFGIPLWGCLFAIIGVAIIIFVNKEDTFTSKILTNKVLVYVGNISFALYLYHFAVIVFYRWIKEVFFFSTITFVDNIAIALISFVLAIGSYYLIEKPFKKLRIMYLLMLIIFILSIQFFNKDYIILYRKFLPTFYPSYHPSFKDNSAIQDICIDKNSDLVKKLFDINCFNNMVDNHSYDILLLGDSNSNTYTYAVKEFALQNNLSIKYVGRFGFNWFNGTIQGSRATTEKEEDIQWLVDMFSTSSFKYIFFATDNVLFPLDNKFFIENSYIKPLLKHNTKMIFLGSIPRIVNSKLHNGALYKMKHTLLGKDINESSIVKKYNLDLSVIKNEDLYNEYNYFVNKYSNVYLFDPSPYITSIFIDGKNAYIDAHHMIPEIAGTYLAEKFMQDFKFDKKHKKID